MRKMKLTDIYVTSAFAESIPTEEKMQQCRENWNKWHRQDRYLVVTPGNNVLIDGYIQYLVLKENGVEEAEVKISTRRKKRWVRKNIEDWKVPHYRTEPTTYIYGKHIHSFGNKEYMWRIPKSWTWMQENIQVGDIVLCAAKRGVSPVQVTRIEVLDVCPVDMVVKKVVGKEIRRNGMVVEYQMNKEELKQEFIEEIKGFVMSDRLNDLSGQEIANIYNLMNSYLSK